MKCFYNITQWLVWCSHNGIGHINKKLCRAQFALGWVMFCGRLASLPSQYIFRALSLTIRPWVDEMSTSIVSDTTEEETASSAQPHDQDC